MNKGRPMKGPGGPMRGPGHHGQGGPRGMAAVKSIDPKTVGRLLGYIFRHHKTVMFIVLVCVMLSSVTAVAGSMFLETLIDDYIVPMTSQSSPDFAPLLRAVLIMGGIFLIGIISTAVHSQIMVVVSQGVLRDIRDEMFEKMQHLPIKYFDTNAHGDIMSRYTNDTDTLRQMISQSLIQTFSSLITLVTVFCAMISLSPILTLIAIVTVALIIFSTKNIAASSGKYFMKQQTSLGAVNGYIEEMIAGQKVVKVFCHEEHAKEDFDKLNGDLYENAFAANKYANILMPIMGNMSHLQYVILAISGGALAISGVGGLTLGAIVSFLQLSRSFTQPITQLSQQVSSIAMALAGAGRIFDLMDTEPEKDGGYVTLVNAKTDGDGNITETPERTGVWAWKHPHGDGSITYTKVEGAVTMDNVDFAYEEGKDVLHNITLYANPGEKVAFVGATGAGKTTITNLINRFYDIADGKIRYDGININKIKKDDLRRSLGIVLQDTNLFTGTVMENIRYGKLDATDEEVYAAARLANADDFIRRLPEGYNTMLTGNGANLSQGQRQLISIARAAVADPPVMILDEATSSIDTRTEALVQHGMDKLMHGRTVFVIAHRLSTVRNSDVIMVLEHGRIIERGNHEKLIGEHGKYYQLYTGGLELE